VFDCLLAPNSPASTLMARYSLEGVHVATVLCTSARVRSQPSVCGPGSAVRPLSGPPGDAPGGNAYPCYLPAIRAAHYERRSVDIRLLRHFIAVAEELHFPRAAMNLDISTQKLRSSIAKLEANLGVVLIDRTSETTRLTTAGNLFLTDARTELAASEEPWKPPRPAGGKAKAAKGKGRAPDVKGQPRPGKRRQSR
jgi:hypothetical protein